MNMRSATLLSAVALVLGPIRAPAELEDSPDQIAMAMKTAPSDIKQGLDRHIIDVTFTSDGNFTLFTFLDGRVCRELYVKKGDAIQEDHIAVLLAKGEKSGHRWNLVPTTTGNQRWQRDDEVVDIVYGSINKSPIKHALVVTASDYSRHLEEIVSNEGRDSPGIAPSLEEIRSRMRLAVGSTNATMRSGNVNPQSASYQFGYALTRYGIPLAIVGLIIRAWTRRVARLTAISTGSSPGRYYRLLLLKMSWRVGVIFIGSMFVVMLSQMSPAIGTQQASEAGALALLLLLLFCPMALLMTSWAQAKQKFAKTSQITTSDIRVAENALPSTQVSPKPEEPFNTNKDPTRRSTVSSSWWKRLFSVLEIGVFLVSLFLTIALYLSLTPTDSRWPLFILLILPVIIVRSVRVALIYIVEGTPPFRR